MKSTAAYGGGLGLYNYASVKYGMGMFDFELLVSVSKFLSFTLYHLFFSSFLFCLFHF